MDTENKIILSACNELKLSTEVFMSGKREKPYMDAKRICVGLILESEHITLQEVASIIGLSHHTSVMHLRDTYNNLMKTDWVFRRKRDRIKASLI